jgi:hypothetical protein
MFERKFNVKNVVPLESVPQTTRFDFEKETQLTPDERKKIRSYLEGLDVRGGTSSSHILLTTDQLQLIDPNLAEEVRRWPQWDDVWNDARLNVLAMARLEDYEYVLGALAHMHSLDPGRCAMFVQNNAIPETYLDAVIANINGNTNSTFAFPIAALNAAVRIAGVPLVGHDRALRPVTLDYIKQRINFDHLQSMIERTIVEKIRDREPWDVIIALATEAFKLDPKWFDTVIAPLLLQPERIGAIRNAIKTTNSIFSGSVTPYLSFLCNLRILSEHLKETKPIPIGSSGSSSELPPLRAI